MAKALTQEQFLEKARLIHGNKYDYSKVVYKNTSAKVCIICPEHGEFWQTPLVHLYSGCGCKECRKDILRKKFKSEKEDFVKQAIKIHGNKYDYSKAVYKNSHTPIIIICPEHGEFEQMPYSHLNGRGCYKCGRKESGKKASKRKTLSTSKFIEKARLIHGDKYDYSKVEYVNNSTKVCIVCPEHGEFWQSPQVHLKGSGCPLCKESKLEKEVYEFLTLKNIEFEKEKTFEWLINKGNLFIDFYIPEHKIGIECQGIQHFVPVSFGENLTADEKKDKLMLVKKRDLIKKTLCEEHGIKMLYYFHNSYFLDQNFYTKDNIIKDLNDIRL